MAEPNAEEEGNVFLSLGVPFLVLWLAGTPLLFFAVLKGCRQTVGDRRIIHNGAVAGFFAILWLVIEFAQVNWFSFNAGVKWPADALLVFFRFFVLDYDLTFYAWFWIYGSYAIFVFVVLLLAMCCCVDGADQSVVIAGVLFMGLVPLFQPFLYRMVQTFNCVYPAGEPAYLEAAPEVECWTGGHVAYVTLAALILAFFYPAITIMSSLLLAGRTTRQLWLAFYYMQFKVAQVVIATLFAGFIAPVLAGMLCITLILAALNVYITSDSPALSYARCISMIMAAWASICLMIQNSVNEPTSWLATVLLIIGWSTIFVMGLIFYIYRRRRDAAEARKPVMGADGVAAASVNPGQPLAVELNVHVSPGAQPMSATSFTSFEDDPVPAPPPHRPPPPPPAPKAPALPGPVIVAHPV